MRTAFEAEGEIRGTDLLAALVALWREGANGTLQFSRSGATAGFELAAGEIVGTSSSDPRFETAAILIIIVGLVFMAEYASGVIRKRVQ